MPELHFKIDGAEAVPHAATPMMALKLRITNIPVTETIHAITLRCQVQIEPAKRRYIPNEQEKLLDLFGTPERWARTVKPLLWMNTSVAAPRFTDFDLAAARRNIESVRPGMQIFEVFAKTGSGMPEVFQFLRDRLARSRETLAALQTESAV
jgi:hypothetical protein